LKRGGVAAGVALPVLLLLMSDAIWQSRDEGIAFTDAAFHWGEALDWRLAWERGIDGVRDTLAEGERQRYGVLLHALLGALSFASGIEPARMSFLLALIVLPALGFGAYHLGREYGPEAGRDQRGVLAVALLIGFPAVANYSRVVILDLALAACSTVAIACALAAMRGAPRAGVGFVVATLLGLATKANVLLFVAGPGLLAFSPGGLRALRARPLRTLLIAASVLIAAAFALSRRAPALLRTAAESTWPGALLGYAREGTLRDWPGDVAQAAFARAFEIAYYAATQTLGPPMLLGAIVLLAVPANAERPARALRWAVLPGALTVWLLLRDLYDERYVLPLLPPLAAALALAMQSLPRRARQVTVVLWLGFAVVQHLCSSFDVLPSLRPLACVTLPGFGHSERVGDSLWACALYPRYRFMDRAAHAHREDWGEDRIEAALASARKQAGRPLRAVFLDDLYEPFYRLHQRDRLREARGDRPLLRHEDDLLLTRCWDEAWMRSVFETRSQVESMLREADVLLFRWGEPRDGPDRAVRGRRCEVAEPLLAAFRHEADLPLEDGTAIRVMVQSAR
jgi:hypothetical protein